MINIIEKDKLEMFLSSFKDEEEIENLLRNKCKFLFIENGDMYFVLYASEEQKDILRKSWLKIKNKGITILNIRNLKPILESEEQALFLEKAIEICNSKKVEISFK